MAGIRKKRRAYVEQKDCVACGGCVKVCPLNAIQVYRGLYAQVDEAKCVGCGKPMEELVPNTVEASSEKHLPAVTVEDGAINVNVGSVDHPMADEHYIEWVYVETENGGQRKYLKPGEEPNVTFSLGDDKAVAVYAYCNLHGLWKTEV